MDAYRLIFRGALRCAALTLTGADQRGWAVKSGLSFTRAGDVAPHALSWITQARSVLAEPVRREPGLPTRSRSGHGVPPGPARSSRDLTGDIYDDPPIRHHPHSLRRDALVQEPRLAGTAFQLLLQFRAGLDHGRARGVAGRAAGRSARCGAERKADQGRSHYGESARSGLPCVAGAAGKRNTPISGGVLGFSSAHSACHGGQHHGRTQGPGGALPLRSPACPGPAYARLRPRAGRTRPGLRHAGVLDPAVRQPRSVAAQAAASCARGRGGGRRSVAVERSFVSAARQGCSLPVTVEHSTILSMEIPAGAIDPP